RDGGGRLPGERQAGALGALLRREGVYSSQLSSWRTQLGAHGTGGLAAKKPGRKPKFTEAERRCARPTARSWVSCSGSAIAEGSFRISGASANSASQPGRFRRSFVT